MTHAPPQDDPPPTDEAAPAASSPDEVSAPEVGAPGEADLGTTGPAKGRAPLWLRLGGLVLLLASLVVVGRLTGLAEVIGSPERLQEAVESAGGWGVLLLIAAFTIGLFIQVPGIVFATAAILCYGRFWGGLLAYGGAVVAVSGVFVSVRALGGQALGEIEKPWARKVLDQIDERPLRTVTLLRLVFWSSPQLNYALALTRVSFRHHLLGTMIGLIPIKIAVAFGIQEVIDQLRAMIG